ncbi:MAG: DUF2510 domain-containing protein [Nocardioidaceae bacterium]
MSDHAPVPGWYPDPYGARGQLRWWDGDRWTPATQQAPPHSPATPLDEEGRGDSGRPWAPPSEQPERTWVRDRTPPPGTHPYEGRPSPYAHPGGVWDSPSWGRRRLSRAWLAAGGGVLVVAALVVVVLASGVLGPGVLTYGSCVEVFSLVM